MPRYKVKIFFLKIKCMYSEKKIHIRKSATSFFKNPRNVNHLYFQSPKPEQSVMQALESLNEQQVKTLWQIFVVFLRCWRGGGAVFFC